MSYKANINKIDNSIKSYFNSVSIDNSDYRNLYIISKEPINEKKYKNLELHLLISQKSLNGLNPIVEWGYYTNSSKRDNVITFKTNLESIGGKLKEIVDSRKLDEEYLNNLQEVSKVNESKDTPVGFNESITKLNKTYKLNYQKLSIEREKIRSFLYNNFNVETKKDKILLECFDVTSGQKKENNIFNSFKLGDEFHFSIKNMKYTDNDRQNISSEDYLKIKKSLSSLPFVEDVFINTNRGDLSVVFSIKILVELV